GPGVQVGSGTAGPPRPPGRPTAPPGAGGITLDPGPNGAGPGLPVGTGESLAEQATRDDPLGGGPVPITREPAPGAVRPFPAAFGEPVGGGGVFEDARAAVAAGAVLAGAAG